MKRLLLAGLILAASTTAFGGSLVTNGSFETLTNPVADQTATILEPGSTELPGWTVTASSPGGNVLLMMGNSANIYDAYVEIGNPFDVAVFQAEQGNYFVDLTGAEGYSGNTLYGGIQQTVATELGVQYQLSFYVGKMADGYVGPDGNNPYAGASTIDLTIGGQDYGLFSNSNSTPSISPNGYPDYLMNWEAFTVDFTGTGNDMTIQFDNATPGINNLAGLDGVDMEEVTAPEPCSVLLFAAGAREPGGSA